MSKKYKVVEEIYLTYNVGRDGIGEVEQFYSVGEIIEGWVATEGYPNQIGKIVTNAVLTLGSPSKSYWTRIYLDPSKLEETTDIPGSQSKDVSVTGVKQIDGVINRIKRMPRKQKIGYGALTIFILILIFKRK